MAQKFGGKYSPDGKSTPGGAGLAQAPVDDRLVDAAGARANVLFVPGLVLAFTSLGSGPTVLIAGLAGAAVLTLAAWLLREGLRAQAAYDARTIARRPALPRKMLASVLTGIGIAIAAWSNDAGVVGSVLYGVAAGALHVAAFGLDPLKDKRMEGVDQFQQDRVARVVDEAEAYLGAMREHIAALGDRKLDLRVAGFQAAARKLIRTVEEDPRDLTEARRFLGVYLMGARDASVKFADLYKRSRDEAARGDYEQLLTDLEQNFAARTGRMLEDGRADMDIEIKVLRDRLRREGIKPEQ